MNRLTSVMNGTSTVEAFGYYADGNFSERSYRSGGTLYSDGYEYDGNRLSILYSHIDEFAYGYDYKGNVSYDPYTGITSFTYDHRNLPLSITNSTGTVYKYRYDDGGNRIYKDAQGKKEYYFRDDLGHELAVYDAAADRLKTVNLYGNDLIGRIDVSWDDVYDEMADEWHSFRYDDRFYYVKDHLGSIRQTLNESGTVMSAMDYYAFGGTKSSYVQGSTVDKYKFTGKERDSETGLDYFGARYYDSKIGRWMSVDPLASKYPGWSPYSYCLNNPLRYYDPEGMDVWEKIRNFINGKGWRDDNLQENYQQQEWDKVTVQLAEEAGVGKDTKVIYKEEMTVPNGNTAGHYTTTTIDDKMKVIVMTKGGYENFDENNLNNSKSSMAHEKGHAEKSLSSFIKQREDKKETARGELDAVKAQRNDKTWTTTTPHYKEKVKNFENVQKWILKQ